MLVLNLFNGIAENCQLKVEFFFAFLRGESPLSLPTVFPDGGGSGVILSFAATAAGRPAAFDTANIRSARTRGGNHPGLAGAASIPNRNHPSCCAPPPSARETAVPPCAVSNTPFAQS